MIPGLLACLLAAIGFELATAILAVRGNPDLLEPIIGYTGNRTLSATQQFELIKLLWLTRWDPVKGWLIASGVLIIIFIWFRAKAIKPPRSALLLAFLTIFSVSAAMAANTLAYESDPLQDASLAALQTDTAGSNVALAANIAEKDVRGRIEYALAGHAHLLNPYYGSFGQSVPQSYLDEIDYVVSMRELSWDVTIMQHWSPFEVLAVVPSCSLVFVDAYETQDPRTRNDLEEITTLEDVQQLTNDIQPLYLYRVDMALCQE